MPWLVVNGTPVCPLELATTPWERSRGLLGRSDFDGAVLLAPAFAVHTIGMRFPIDVAFCSSSLRVIATVTMARHRLGRPRARARSVLEAAAGAFASWGLTPGSQLAIRDD
ncbi:MAG TPA: DUF192 domain-containing protein [Acidimicrobiales bacterium]|nr:DUF192 domain-containing protein [Acidimicrobiales bacterium]